MSTVYSKTPDPFSQVDQIESQVVQALADNGASVTAVSSSVASGSIISVAQTLCGGDSGKDCNSRLAALTADRHVPKHAGHHRIGSGFAISLILLLCLAFILCTGGVILQRYKRQRLERQLAETRHPTVDARQYDQYAHPSAPPAPHGVSFFV